MSTATTEPLPVSHQDPVNKQILVVSEDRIQGFHRDPLGEISRLSGVPVETVAARITAMLRAGTIRRVRQTLMSTNLAPGALVAWNVPAENLEPAFEFLFKQDPFSGHVVVRSTDAETPGSQYKLWTTLKVPQGFSLEKHCELLRARVGARSFRIMPARGIFALGVGHARRSSMEPGARIESPAVMNPVRVTHLEPEEWRVLKILKREFAPEEIGPFLWEGRAREAGLAPDEFYAVAERLVAKQVIGRFSTFLEHVKPTATGERVTRFNALFHWAAPKGQEEAVGREVGRHIILTHCYWREGGPEFNHVNIMAVAHGTEKEKVLAHKAAIDGHLRDCGFSIPYTNIFWGGRSEIKPSEIFPDEYEAWARSMGADPAAMKA